MKKLSLLIIYFIIITLYASGEDRDYVVKTSGDTVYGKIKMLYYPLGKGRVFKLKTSSKEKFTFHKENAKLVHYKNADYVVKKIKPHKRNTQKEDFVKVMIKNGESAIYRYQVTQMTGGQYNTSTTTTTKYYLYHKGKFVDYIKKKKYKSLMIKYFSNCERFTRELKHNKKLKLKDTFDVYNNHCKN